MQRFAEMNHSKDLDTKNNYTQASLQTRSNQKPSIGGKTTKLAQLNAKVHAIRLQKQQMSKTNQTFANKKAERHKRSMTIGEPSMSDRHNYQSRGGSVPLSDLLKQTAVSFPASSLTPKISNTGDMRVTYTFKQFRKDSIRDHTKAILPTVKNKVL